MSQIAQTELILPGVAPAGSIAERLILANGDIHQFRPYVESDGRSYMTINMGSFEKPKLEVVPTANAALLRKDEWSLLDSRVLMAARQRLRAWADLRAANTYTIDGMGTMVLEGETISDEGEAQVDFDGLSEGPASQPKFDLEGLPIAITHSSFWFSARRLMISRKMGNGINVTMGEQAGRRVAEMIERTLIGTVTGPSLSPRNVAQMRRTPVVQGYTNFTYRVTKNDVTAPTTGGWTPKQLLEDVLDMIDSLNDLGFYGPFMLYTSTDWDQYLELDYSDAKGDNTLRDRLRKIEQIRDVRRLDLFTSTFSLVLVQMTSDVVEAVNGMELTTVQWESKGGARIDFRVMAIQVPRLKADITGATGICHGTTS